MGISSDQCKDGVPELEDQADVGDYILRGTLKIMRAYKMDSTSVK